MDSTSRPPLDQLQTVCASLGSLAVTDGSLDEVRQLVIHQTQPDQAPPTSLAGRQLQPDHMTIT